MSTAPNSEHMFIIMSDDKKVNLAQLRCWANSRDTILHLVKHKSGIMPVGHVLGAMLQPPAHFGVTF